jgi:hypothetical protein
LVSAVTDWYAELPMTSAIRFSANAVEPADATHASIATMERKRRTITDLPLADINVGRARQRPARAPRTPRKQLLVAVARRSFDLKSSCPISNNAWATNETVATSP